MKVEVVTTPSTPLSLVSRISSSPQPLSATPQASPPATPAPCPPGYRFCGSPARSSPPRSGQPPNLPSQSSTAAPQSSPRSRTTKAPTTSASSAVAARPQARERPPDAVRRVNMPTARSPRASRVVRHPNGSPTRSAAAGSTTRSRWR
jgi:hypothetical protein